MPENTLNSVKDRNCEKLWVAVGDIHGETGKLARIPELAKASGIIVTGDLTNGGGVAEAARVLDKVKNSSLPVLAQVGNMDKMEIDTWLNEQDCNLHTKVRELTPEIAIFGIGGSTITPMNTYTEFPEEEYAKWLDQEWAIAKKYPHTILVSHNPPANTRCDAINANLHVGSKAVREFIEKEQPDICICGHIHEGSATDSIGRTIIVNPGTLASGGYAVICLKDGKLEAWDARV